jgi:hypothetical protein
MIFCIVFQYLFVKSCIISLLLSMEFLFDCWVFFFFEKQICLTLCFSLIFILHFVS